jgi:hypothetical protein
LIADAVFHQKQSSRSRTVLYGRPEQNPSKAHYGIGLYVPSLSAEQHGGGLLLENASDTGGGIATIYFPI